MQQAEHFCNSIGILQQCSVPSKFPGFERIGAQQANENSQEDYAQLFSTLISRYSFTLCPFQEKIHKKKCQNSFHFRCAKDIDTLIESLPNEDSSQELQAQSLRRLESENQEAAKRLEEVSSEVKVNE